MDARGAKTTQYLDPPPVSARSNTPIRIASLVVVLAVAILGAQFVRTTRPLNRSHGDREINALPGDYENYISASAALRDGGRLYYRGLIWRETGWANHFPGEKPPTEGTLYLYPPLLAVALVPLTTLPPNVSSLVWFSLLFAAVLAVAYLLSGLLGVSGRLYRLAGTLGLAALMVLYQPVRASLTSAQVDCLLLLLLTSSMCAFLRRRDVLAAALLAVSVAVKPFLGFLVLFFVWKRAYRAAAAACALSAALVLVPFVFLGLGTLSDFVAVVLYCASPAYSTDPNNISPNGLLLRLFTSNVYTVPLVDAPWLVPLVRFGAVGAVLLIWARGVSRSRNHPPAHLALEFGATLVAMLLVSPVSEDIHLTYLVILFVAGTATVRARWSTGWNPVGLGMALAVAFLYLCIPTLRSIHMAYYAFHTAPLVGLQVWLTGVHLYGLIFLAAVVFATVRWSRNATAEPLMAIPIP